MAVVGAGAGGGAFGREYRLLLTFLLLWGGRGGCKGCPWHSGGGGRSAGGGTTGVGGTTSCYAAIIGVFVIESGVVACAVPREARGDRAG